MKAAMRTWWRESPRWARVTDILIVFSTGISLLLGASSMQAHLKESDYWLNLGIMQVAYGVSLVALGGVYALMRVLSQRYWRRLSEIAGFRAGGACEKRTM